MEEDETPPPIPGDLHCEYEERPFQHCTRCGETLGDDPGGFQIAKAYRRGECVMEYALCDHCRGAMMEEFSEESKGRLMAFQDEKVNPETDFHHCGVCGAQRSEGGTGDFVITGICHGGSMLHGMMMCGECGDDVQELISVKTRDTWRRFVNENFPGPPGEGEYPEIEELPSQPMPVFNTGFSGSAST